jgi:ribose transport system permease protein
VLLALLVGRHRAREAGDRERRLVRRRSIRFAIPLAILAGCQTLTMLTGGIDLSVGAIASMAAFVLATQSPAGRVR